jgi:hypothetical protein
MHGDYVGRGETRVRSLTLQPITNRKQITEGAWLNVFVFCLDFVCSVLAFRLSAFISKAISLVSITPQSSAEVFSLTGSQTYFTLARH